MKNWFTLQTVLAVAVREQVVDHVVDAVPGCCTLGRFGKRRALWSLLSFSVVMRVVSVWKPSTKRSHHEPHVLADVLRDAVGGAV